MTVLRFQSHELFELAARRATREDLQGIATWRYRGSEPRVLFIHGFRGDHHGLQAIIGALPNLDCVVPDLPGFGKSIQLDSHDLQSYGRWLVDYVKSTGPYDAIVGHSFGTLVVASALSQSLGISRVVLINPITTRASDSKSLANRVAERYYRVGRHGLFGNWLLSSGLITRAMSIGLVKSKRPSLRRFVHDQHAKYFSTFGSQISVTEGFAAANTGSIADHLDFLPDNTLLIAGQQDIVAPLIATRKLAARLPGGKLVELPKVGHLTHYEKPQQVAEAISEFLEHR